MNSVTTKQKGDIAELAVSLKGLKFGWQVLKPIGDRSPYDLAFEINGQIVKIQVKSAWYNSHDENYIIDVRRTKTNRRIMKREYYQNEDFDFAIGFIEDLDQFYIFPVDVFLGFKSAISLVVNDKRQRKPKSFEYFESWSLIESFVKNSKIELDKLLEPNYN